MKAVVSTGREMNPFSEIIDTLYDGRFCDDLEDNSQVISPDGRSTGAVGKSLISTTLGASTLA